MLQAHATHPWSTADPFPAELHAPAREHEWMQLDGCTLRMVETVKNSIIKTVTVLSPGSRTTPRLPPRMTGTLGTPQRMMRQLLPASYFPAACRRSTSHSQPLRGC